MVRRFLPVTVARADVPHVLWVMQDIIDRKQSEDKLMAAIEAVMADTSWFSRSVVEKLAAIRRTGSASMPDAGLGELTRREREILHLICLGMSNAEMGRELNLSPTPSEITSRRFIRRSASTDAVPP